MHAFCCCYSSAVGGKQIAAHQLLWIMSPYLMTDTIFSLIELYGVANTMDEYRLRDYC